jgi:hypothetical protein
VSEDQKRTNTVRKIIPANDVVRGIMRAWKQPQPTLATRADPVHGANAPEKPTLQAEA